MFAVLVAGFAAFALVPSAPSASDRLLRATGHVRSSRSTARPTVSRRPQLLLLAAAPAALGLAVAGTTAAAVVGGLAAVVIWRRGHADRRSADIGEVALAIDVLAGCLAAGATMPSALRAAAVAGSTELGRHLTAVAEALAEGANPASAWAACAELPALAPLARVCTRGLGTGASVAAELRASAARERQRRRAQLNQHVNRASVWAVLPLGTCFLPAFVLVGVVPLVLGLLMPGWR
jgi:Flp pilus assembly protein TadB